MIFDSEISVQDVSLGTPSPEALEAGVPPHVELGIVAGLALPFTNPETGQPLVVPAGKYKFTLTRAQAIDVFTAALKAAEALPEQFAPSGKLLVANDLSAVEQAAQKMRRVTGK